MAINRFDRPVNLDYNYTPYMPELFMPDFNAILKAGQVQDQITEESNKLASTKPNYIPTTQYTAYDEHGNETTKTFGDTAGFEAYQGKQKEWQDRLTNAKLSGDANVFNRERDKIADEVKQSMLPDGQFYNLDTRYKNYVGQLQNMQKEKSMEDAGYKTAGNYGHDVMNFYNGIGEYKGDGKTSSNFGYNITPYTDINKVLDENAAHIGADGYKVERDTVNGRFIVRDKNGVEEKSPEKVRQVLEPIIQDPRVQQQLRVESYNKATYTPEELNARIESAKTQQEAYLNNIKDNTAELTKEATGLGIEAKGKSDEELYNLISKKLEEDRTTQADAYGKLDADQRRALMLQENYRNKYVNPNVVEHSWRKTDDGQQLRYDDLWMSNYKSNLDLGNMKAMAVFNQPKNGIIATSSASTPQDLKSLFKVQENLYKQYDVQKQQLDKTVGTSDRLLSPDEFATKFGGVSDDNAYNAYKQEYQSMEASKHRASGLYNQLHSKDNDYAGEVYDKMNSTDKQQLDTFMKNEGITDRAQGLRAIYEYTEKQKESSPTSKTGERKVNNPFTKYFNTFEDKRNKGIENGEIQVQTIGFTPLDGSEAETVQKTIDNIYTNPDKKFALLKEAVSKGLIKPNELPDKTGDKFKVIIGTIPGTGQLTLNASYLDSSGQPHSFVLDESSIPSEKQVFEVWKQSAKDAISDQAGNITSNNPNTKVIAQTIAEHNINTLIDSGNLSTEDFNSIKQQYKNKPELLAKTLSTPIFSIKAGGNTTSVTYDPSSVVNPYKEDRFFINTKDANGKITTNVFEGSFDDLKSTIGWSLQRDNLYQQEKPHPILNKQ